MYKYEITGKIVIENFYFIIIVCWRKKRKKLADGIHLFLWIQMLIINKSIYVWLVIEAHAPIAKRT